MPVPAAAFRPRKFIDRSRRALLRFGLATGVFAALRPAARAQSPAQDASGWPAAAFAEQSLAETMAILFGDEPLEESRAIAIDMVDLAEDGAVIPVRIDITLPGVENLAILAEKNPVPLIALFDLGTNVEPQLAARIKMAESAHVIAVVRAGGRLFTARRFIQVVRGGCY